MRFEIERKFMVTDDRWREAATGARNLKDGLVGHFARGKVRVRRDEERAWLTVKGGRVDGGISRPEFEYEISPADAEAMLRNVCVGCLIEKTRYCVPHAGLIWEVDVFQGALAGIILAEVELTHEAQVFERPNWAGEEVTADLRFRQSTLLHLYGQSDRPVTLADVLALPRSDP
ncbi:conserved protein of unknown function [Methylorubrum extorquens DM4]|uniref:CYTH domain-containing protein n=1 Tax=Methylorubrum extorquens (strain DSM 6343 / CIP 106787 / DM4) TaxID=661410 RepID=C7CCB1_METED|nr:CYTH domain-containing protein [Methylorubrum extorquens]CAX22457.1 conserved protein of unknown function [Methylorubrum extorquens DM4]